MVEHLLKCFTFPTMQHTVSLETKFTFFQTNDGPVCRCSAADKKQGIRHGIYPGEKVG